MDWNTLFSVALGGLIATLGSILNNRFQSRERDKDRQEARKESKTQLALELRRDDFNQIEKAIDYALKTVDIAENIRTKMEVGKISKEEMDKEIDSMTFDDGGVFSHLGELNLIAEKLAYSFGEEFHQEFKEFYKEVEENLKYTIRSPIFLINESEKLDLVVYRRAAKLHNMLVEQLISIKDT